MNKSAFLAIAWKEYRQIRGMMIGMIVFTFLLMLLPYLLGDQSNPADAWSNSASIFIILLPCLAFMLGAGIRIVEQSNRGDAWMRLRPIPLSSMFIAYFAMGMAAWFFWLGVYSLLCVFWYEVSWISPLYWLNSQIFSLLLFMTAIYFLCYSYTFCIGLLLSSHFLICGSLSLGFYVGFWFMAFRSDMLLTLVILILPCSLYGTYRIYRQRELGRKS